MTTIDMSAHPALAARVPATRLRLTTRGRRVVAMLVSVPAAIALSVVILSSGGALASNENGAPAGTFSHVTVMPGDTLWSIAQDVAPGVDPRDVVDEIVRLNALPSGAIEAGESIAIPQQYAPAR